MKDVSPDRNPLVFPAAKPVDLFFPNVVTSPPSQKQKIAQNELNVGTKTNFLSNNSRSIVSQSI